MSDSGAMCLPLSAMVGDQGGFENIVVFEVMVWGGRTIAKSAMRGATRPFKSRRPFRGARSLIVARELSKRRRDWVSFGVCYGTR